MKKESVYVSSYYVFRLFSFSFLFFFVLSFLIHFFLISFLISSFTKCLFHFSYLYIFVFLLWDAFAKFRKATIRSTMSVRLSVPPHETIFSHCTDFHEIWYLSISRKSVEDTQISLKSDKNNQLSEWRTIYIFGHISLSFSENEKKIVEKIEIISYSIFFSKIDFLWVNVEKYCGAGQATDYYMEHALCMLGN
jgi:hypothetical protein